MSSSLCITPYSNLLFPSQPISDFRFQFIFHAMSYRIICNLFSYIYIYIIIYIYIYINIKFKVNLPLPSGISGENKLKSEI